MAALTQSYVHGASSTPLLGETIGALLGRMAEEGPQRLALVARHQNVRWTYADLLETVRGPRGRRSRRSASKKATGSASGRPTTASGCWRSSARALAGLILVNINPAYRSHEFDYAIRKSGCRALILARLRGFVVGKAGLGFFLDV